MRSPLIKHDYLYLKFVKKLVAKSPKQLSTFADRSRWFVGMYMYIFQQKTEKITWKICVSLSNMGDMSKICQLFATHSFTNFTFGS